MFAYYIWSAKTESVKPQSPLVFRLQKGLHERLEKCAKETRLKKYALALLAIEAAVEAIEKNNYELVVPIKFEVSRVPAASPKNLSSSNSQGGENSGEEPGPAKAKRPAA